MIEEQLNDINKEIINVFKKFNISENEMLDVYKNCYNDFERLYIVNVDIEEQTLNYLRDTIWFNIEHDKEKDLTRLGKVFPTFMSFCDNDDYISYNESQDLNSELIEIKRHLNKHKIYLSYMVGPVDNFEDKKSIINFIDKRTQKLIENDHVRDDEITCFIENEITHFPLKLAKFNSLLDALIDSTEKSIKNKSRIKVNFI